MIDKDILVDWGFAMYKNGNWERHINGVLISINFENKAGEVNFKNVRYSFDISQASYVEIYEKIRTAIYYVLDKYRENIDNVIEKLFKLKNDDFKIFDVVLVRNNDIEDWIPAFYGRKIEGKIEVIGGAKYKQVLPYTDKTRNLIYTNLNLNE